LCNEAGLGSLIAAARASPWAKSKGAVPGAPRGRSLRTPRPAGYLANGSFQGKLLRSRKTRPVSPTHRRHERGTRRRRRGTAVDQKYLGRCLGWLRGLRVPFCATLSAVEGVVVLRTGSGPTAVDVAGVAPSSRCFAVGRGGTRPVFPVETGAFCAPGVENQRNTDSFSACGRRTRPQRTRRAAFRANPRCLAPRRRSPPAEHISLAERNPPWP